MSMNYYFLYWWLPWWLFWSLFGTVLYWGFVVFSPIWLEDTSTWETSLLRATLIMLVSHILGYAIAVVRKWFLRDRRIANGEFEKLYKVE